MLAGIHPLLTGEFLAHLDAMGHSDSVVLADAHFPAQRLARWLLTFPGLGTPELGTPDVIAAVRSVLPLDDSPAVDVMATPDGARLPIQEALISAAPVGWDDVRPLERHGFYAVAADAYLIVRTGETRVYGSAILRKGGVTAAGEDL